MGDALVNIPPAATEYKLEFSDSVKVIKHVLDLSCGSTPPPPHENG